MIRILIVDDQKTVRESIRSILEAESGIEIVGVAVDGYEGIRLAIDLAPDIVLMDLEMPNLDGLAATKLICQQNPDLNVIILTIQDRDDLLIQALNAGAKGYLLKSIDAREIINTINLIYKGSELFKQKNHHSVEILNVDRDTHHKLEAVSRTVNKNDSERKIHDRSYVEKMPDRTLRRVELATERSQFTVTPQHKPNFLTLLSVLKRRYPPALMGFMGVLFGAILYLIFAPRTYKATASIILEARQESISDLGKDLNDISGNKEYSLLASQAKLINSLPVVNNALKNIVRADDYYLAKSISPDDVRDNLEVTVVPNTNILEVSYVNSNPELVPLLLNEIVNSLIARNTNSIRSEASSVRQFLEKKVSEQRQELSQLETAENNYREQKGIISLDKQTTNLIDSLNNLESQEQALLTETKEQEAIVNNLQQITRVDNAEAAYTKGKIGQDRQLEILRTQLTDTEAELAAARSNMTDNNPVVIALQEKRAEIIDLYRQQTKKILGENATISPSEITGVGLSQTENGLGQNVFDRLITSQTQLKADREKLKAIRLEKQKLTERIASLPSNVQSLTELVRQREQADENLQFLQRKLEEARIAEAQLISNVRIVELANMPTSPSSPKTPLVLAVASVVGAILAASIILLLEKSDRSIYEGSEVESQLHIPFLAALPNLSANAANLRQIKSFLHNREFYEPYRSLLKRLESSSKNELKVIVVTSAIAEEGKTTVASHLGAVSAMLSKRTLIIDAHISQPEQHRLFGVKRQPGLSEIVTDGFTLHKAVQHPEIANLSVLAVGVATSSSCVIMESPLIKNMLLEASAQYDLVIIDAPPASDNCDALTLSKYSDGLVIVTRPHYTTIDTLERIVVDLKKNEAPILGFVINHADRQERKLISDRNETKHISSLLVGSEQNNNSHQNVEETSKP